MRKLLSTDTIAHRLVLSVCVSMAKANNERKSWFSDKYGQRHEYIAGPRSGFIDIHGG